MTRNGEAAAPKMSEICTVSFVWEMERVECRSQGKRGGSRSSKKRTNSFPEPREEEGVRMWGQLGEGQGKDWVTVFFLELTDTFWGLPNPSQGLEGPERVVCKWSLSRVPPVSQRPYQNQVDCISLPLHIAVWDVYGEHLFNRERGDLQKPEL